MRLRVTAVWTSLVLLVAIWPAVASAQNVEKVECDAGNSPLTESYADVIVRGDCTLDGAYVFGSVLNDGGGDLTTQNGTTILGSIQVKSAGDVSLAETSVAGALSAESSGNLSVNSGTSLAGVTVKDSGYVTVADGASTGELNVENSVGPVTVAGSVGSIFSSGSGGVEVTDGRVFPGGVTVSEGGGLGVTASEIEGSVIVEKGTGDVSLNDVTMASGDLIVVEQVGDISVSGDTQLSDVKLEKNGGDVSLHGVTTDSDTTIVENGDVTMSSSMLGSDVSITSNGAVTLTGNDFALEDVFISGNRGPVLVDSNTNFSVGLIENAGVTFSSNTFTDADISKNTGGVSINANTGEVLKCFDNSPPPTGSGNNIAELADGQCAGF